VPHGELRAKKWLDSIEKQKRRSNLKGSDRQTDKQTESVVENSRLLAGRGGRQLCQQYCRHCSHPAVFITLCITGYHGNYSLDAEAGADDDDGLRGLIISAR